MLSKSYNPFNQKLFYLSLNEYCCYNINEENKIREDITFWDSWMGGELFDDDFLFDTFNNINSKILLGFLKNSNNIYDIHNNLEGIIIFSELCDLFYNIPLIAKRYDSKINWIGRKLIKKLTNLVQYNLDFREHFILTDESDIPNYYEKLGFKKVNYIYLQRLLDNFDDNIYIKKFT